jgi:hypothetical protein
MHVVDNQASKLACFKQSRSVKVKKTTLLVLRLSIADHVSPPHVNSFLMLCNMTPRHDALLYKHDFE